MNKPTSRSTPPTNSRAPAKPGSELSGAVLPPGMTAAGNASSFAEPNCAKRNAATMRKVLRKYGAHDFQRAIRLVSLVGPPHFVARHCRSQVYAHYIMCWLEIAWLEGASCCTSAMNFSIAETTCAAGFSRRTMEACVELAITMGS